MINFNKRIIRPILVLMNLIGFDLRKALSLKNYLRYRSNKREWLKKGGLITYNNIILSDYQEKAGVTKGHYFNQDLLVAKFIHDVNPKRHIDVGSRIDGFVAHVASFRKIEVIDIRPLEKSDHKNIEFIQADLINPHNLGETDSISCLHAIEHFGLGRYGDPIDIDGHNKGITNLINLLSIDGYLYISFPIGYRDEVHFNAHRVFRFDTILKHPSVKKNMQLVRFDFVDDAGNLHTNARLNEININIKFGCGIYTFKKVAK